MDHLKRVTLLALNAARPPVRPLKAGDEVARLFKPIRSESRDRDE